MGILSKLENTMEDGIEGAAGAFGHSKLSPVQIIKKAEKQMRRERIVGAGKQYAPTLYTVLVSRDDDRKLSSYYPTLSGEIETYLLARAREMGYAMDGHPLVRFLVDPELKRGKFDVIAEMVTSSIIERLRDDEMERYGISAKRRSSASNRANAKDRYKNVSKQPNQPNMQPLVNLQAARQYGSYSDSDHLDNPSQSSMSQSEPLSSSDRFPAGDPFADEPSMLRSGSREISREERLENDNFQSIRLREVVRQAKEIEHDFDEIDAAEPYITLQPDNEAVGLENAAQRSRVAKNRSGVDALFGDPDIEEGAEFDDQAAPTFDIANSVTQSTRDAEQPLDVYLYDEARDTAYQLNGNPQKIGRESSNDIVVPDINISRQHAEIRREPNGAWVLQDLGSTNGMYVNGIKVKQAPLRDADMITIGTTTLEFQLLG